MHILLNHNAPNTLPCSQPNIYCFANIYHFYSIFMSIISITAVKSQREPFEYVNHSYILEVIV